MLRKITGYALATLMVATIVLGTFTKVSANEGKELEGTINSYKQQKVILKGAEEATQELENIQREIKKAYEEFQDLDERSNHISNEMEVKQNEIDGTELRIKELRGEIQDLAESITERDELLKGRVRSMYRTGGINYIEVLLGAKSFGDLIERVFALNTIAKQDRAILEKHVRDKEALAMAKNELELQLVSLIDQKNELGTLMEQIDKKRNEKLNLVETLERKQIDVENILVSFEEEKKILENQEAAAEAELKLFENEQYIQENDNNSTSNNSVVSNNTSSLLMWPTQSTDVTSPYGTRIHPVYKTQEFHSGIDISKRGGRNIIAAESGTVIEARYMGGYGNVVMISHMVGGQKLTTLYAHLASIDVNVGQRVERGQRIAEMGTTGVSTGVHLHFEVHEGGWNSQKSNSVDPMKYFK